MELTILEENDIIESGDVFKNESDDIIPVYDWMIDLEVEKCREIYKLFKGFEYRYIAFYRS
jgi:hypothetical protein